MPSPEVFVYDIKYFREQVTYCWGAAALAVAQEQFSEETIVNFVHNVKKRNSEGKFVGTHNPDAIKNPKLKELAKQDAFANQRGTKMSDAVDRKILKILDMEPAPIKYKTIKEEVIQTLRKYGPYRSAESTFNKDGTVRAGHVVAVIGYVDTGSEFYVVKVSNQNYQVHTLAEHTKAVKTRREYHKNTYIKLAKRNQEKRKFYNDKIKKYKNLINTTYDQREIDNYNKRLNKYKREKANFLKNNSFTFDKEAYELMAKPIVFKNPKLKHKWMFYENNKGNPELVTLMEKKIGKKKLQQAIEHGRPLSSKNHDASTPRKIENIVHNETPENIKKRDKQSNIAPIEVQSKNEPEKKTDKWARYKQELRAKKRGELPPNHVVEKPTANRVEKLKKSYLNDSIAGASEVRHKKLMKIPWFFRYGRIFVKAKSMQFGMSGYGKKGLGKIFVKSLLQAIKNSSIFVFRHSPRLLIALFWGGVGFFTTYKLFEKQIAIDLDKDYIPKMTSEREDILIRIKAIRGVIKRNLSKNNKYFLEMNKKLSYYRYDIAKKKDVLPEADTTPFYDFGHIIILCPEFVIPFVDLLARAEHLLIILDLFNTANHSTDDDYFYSQKMPSSLEDSVATMKKDMDNFLKKINGRITRIKSLKKKYSRKRGSKSDEKYKKYRKKQSILEKKYRAFKELKNDILNIEKLYISKKKEVEKITNKNADKTEHLLLARLAKTYPKILKPKNGVGEGKNNSNKENDEITKYEFAFMYNPSQKIEEKYLRKNGYGPGYLNSKATKEALLTYKSRPKTIRKKSVFRSLEKSMVVIKQHYEKIIENNGKFQAPILMANKFFNSHFLPELINFQNASVKPEYVWNYYEKQGVLNRDI